MFILLNREQMCWHFAKALVSALYRENNAVFSTTPLSIALFFPQKKSNLSCRKMQYHMRRSPVTCIVINPRRHQPASRHVCTTWGVLVVDEHILKHCNQLLVMFPVSKVFICCLLMLFWRRSEQSLTFFYNENPFEILRSLHTWRIILQKYKERCLFFLIKAQRLKTRWLGNRNLEIKIE